MTDPDDLVARLRRRYRFARSGSEPHVNPDGPEAAAEIERLRDLFGRYAAYCCNLSTRDWRTISEDEWLEIWRYRDAGEDGE